MRRGMKVKKKEEKKTVRMLCGSSSKKSGLDEVMDRHGYTPTMEFDLLGKLARDSIPLELELELGRRSAMELDDLKNRLASVLEANDAALENLQLMEKEKFQVI